MFHVKQLVIINDNVPRETMQNVPRETMQNVPRETMQNVPRETFFSCFLPVGGLSGADFKKQ